MPINNSDIHNELAKKYGKHKAIISMICNHPFIFASRRIADPDDEKSLMFAYFGKIKLKNRFKNRKRIINDEAEDRKNNIE